MSGRTTPRPINDRLSAALPGVPKGDNGSFISSGRTLVDQFRMRTPRLNIEAGELDKRLANMPTFKFTFNPEIAVAEPQLRTFADLDSARDFARLSVRFISGEQLKEKGRLDLNHYIDIEDQGGALLERMKFGDVLEVEGLRTLLPVD